MRCLPRFWIVFIVLALAGTGCTGLKQPHLKVDTYTLDYAPPAVQGRPLSFGLLVERFQVSPLYDGERIVFREERFTRGSYDYHRWRTNPGDLIPYFLARDLRASGLFHAVHAMDSRVPADYAIAGCVEEIVEIDGPEHWEALLAVTITLVKSGEPDPSRQVLMQKQYRSTKTCAAKHPKAVVEALSQAMAELSAQVIADVHSRLLGQSPSLVDNSAK